MILRILLAGVAGLPILMMGGQVTRAEENPRRTRTVETIERIDAGVVAIFVNEKGQQRSGSGSILDPRGYIVTNDHVVGGGDGIVLVRNLPPLRFRTLGRLTERDLALIKIDPPGPLTVVPLGRSHDLMAGEPILLGGNPGGRGITFTSGIISATSVMPGASALVGAYFRGDTRDRFIQFDAASNPGNSGGPLINAEGRQIGVVSGKIKDEENVNYAIPVDRFLVHAKDLLATEERGGFVTGFALRGAEVAIDRVMVGSVAEELGLQAGDTLTRLGEQSIHNPLDYQLALLNRKAGDKLPISWSRGDESLTGELELAPYPLTKPTAPEKREPGLAFRLYREKVSRVPDPARLGEPAATGVAPQLKLSDVPGLPEDDYVLFLEGWLEVPADGVYWVALKSDDGSRLWLDDELCVDHDGPHPASWASARKRLAAGWHAVRVGYFELSGDADLDFGIGRDGLTEALPVKWSHAVP